MKTLILGGIRSGKSQLAARLATESKRVITYVATARPDDHEMQVRIQAHQQQRPAEWSLIEEPLALAQMLKTHDCTNGLLLVDCLTLWVTNLLLLDDTARFWNERTSLLEIFPHLRGDVVLVSNEAGLGIVPVGELSRRFCDEAGRLHQELAQLCERVVFTVAGLPQMLKGTL